MLAGVGAGQPGIASLALTGCPPILLPHPPLQVATPKGGLLVSAQGAWGSLPAARVLNETTAGFGMVQIIDQVLLPASLEPAKPKPKPKSPPPHSPKRKGKIGGGLATDVVLSQGKPASASSTWSGGGSSPASNANDGDMTNLFHNACTQDGSGPWWSVDLGSKVRAPAAAVGAGYCRMGAGRALVWEGP